MNQTYDKIVNMLITYVEEWGEENVVVYLPRTWEQYKDSLGFRTVARFYFTTKGEISICAVGQDQQILCGWTANETFD